MTNSQSLSTVTRMLHAIIALGMISLLAIGIYMEEFEVFALYDWHKSFGVLVLMFAVVRVFWRIRKGWPSTLGQPAKLQLFIAKAIHWILISATIIYPVSGLMMSIGGGHDLAFFGIELVAGNQNAAGETVAVNETLAGLGHRLHGTLTFFVIGAIVLHVIGALKHHFIDKDATITRMFSSK